MTVRGEIAQSRRVAPIATEAQWVPGAPPRGTEAYLREYVEGLSGEPPRARYPERGQAGRSSEWAIAAEALMNNPG